MIALITKDFVIVGDKNMCTMTHHGTPHCKHVSKTPLKEMTLEEISKQLITGN
jgi:hypothetical protein